MGNNMPEGVKTTLGWAVGLAAIALVFVITLILFGNLSGNSGIPDATSTLVIHNETDAWLNGTDYTLSRVNSSTSGYVLTAILSEQGGEYNLSVLLGNATVSSAGVVSNLSAVSYTNVSISYTLTYSYTSQNEQNFENTIGNYSQSAVNTTAQFPTVGTILGVAILLVILITVLIFAIKKMMGITGSKDSTVTSNGGFG